MSWGLSLAVVLLLSSAAMGVEAKSFELARRGKPLVTVVVPRDIDNDIKAAVDDLVLYVEKSSGAKLPVVRDGEAVSGLTIQIGQTEAVCKAGLSLGKLQYDSYAVSVRGTDILISGRSDQGTIYGVYGFLRDHLGIRWFMPGELWEVVPNADPLLVEVADTTVNPDFPYRVWQAAWYSPDIKQWCTRNRITNYPFEPPDFPYRTFNHNLNAIFPVSKYGREHPEYYSEINGKRLLPTSDSDSRGEPCFTNREVIRITVETIRRYFSENARASQYSLSVNDNLDFCTCPNCSVLDSPRREHRGTVQHSESYFHFVEQVANEIADSHPDKTLGCLAYWAVELPPRNITRLPGNVVIELTQDTSQHFDPKYRDQDRSLFRQWSKSAGRIIQYDYYALGWLTPRYYPNLLADNLKWIRRNGAVGTYAEIYPYWATQSPMIYMALELAWDLNQNPEAVLDDYFAALYGETAHVMKQFYAALERVWMKPRSGKWFQGFLILDGEIAIFDIEAMTAARGLLDHAEAQSSGIVRDRVRYVKRYFEFSYLLEAGHAAAVSLKKLPLGSQSDFDRLAAEMVRVLQIARLTEQTYEKTLKNDPIYLLSYKPSVDWYQFGIEYKLDPWEDVLVNAVKEQLLRLGEWANANLQPDQVAKSVGAVQSKLSGISIRRGADWQSTIGK